MVLVSLLMNYITIQTIVMKSILYPVLLLLIVSCENNSSEIQSSVSQFVNSKNDSFDKYWYQGVAEISSFELEQARYGEVHSGEAVMIFVTEDFSKSKQVKLDNPSANKVDAVPILKLNFTKKFFTGIYPYSMMTSVFTPTDLKRSSHSLKVTCTSQEWCGHTFSQLNLDGDKFKGNLFSYFESEGDVEFKIKNDLLEDEIWAKLRIDPKSLPTGKKEVIPSSMFTRLGHIPIKAYAAELSLEKGKQKGIMNYTIDYPDLNRRVSIEFKDAFPYEIESFEEIYPDGYGSKAKVLTTKAKRKKTILLDYWTKNDLVDAALREKLELTNGN